MIRHWTYIIYIVIIDCGSVSVTCTGKKRYKNEIRKKQNHLLYAHNIIL